MKKGKTMGVMIFCKKVYVYIYIDSICKENGKYKFSKRAFNLHLTVNLFAQGLTIFCDCQGLCFLYKRQYFYCSGVLNQCWTNINIREHDIVRWYTVVFYHTELNKFLTWNALKSQFEALKIRYFSLTSLKTKIWLTIY